MNRFICTVLLLALFCHAGATDSTRRRAHAPAGDTCQCSTLLNRDRKAMPLPLHKRKWQNVIRDNPKLSSPFEKKLVENFFWQCGNYQVTADEYTAIQQVAATQWKSISDSVLFIVAGANYTAKRINFYGAPSLDYALGRAWIIADEAGNFVGFYDHYNFNKVSFLGPNRRSVTSEIATRFIRLFRRQTSDFYVYYGVIPMNVQLAVQTTSHAKATTAVEITPM